MSLPGSNRQQIVLSAVFTTLCLTPLAVEHASGVELDTRVKAVANWLDADSRDIVSSFGVDPAYGANFDLRFTLTPDATSTSASSGNSGTWRWELAAEITALQGDVVENSTLFSGQSSGETTALLTDARRAINLTQSISSGSRHAVNTRLDRAQLILESGKWRVQAGRQALSLGHGRVFNPMDIFSPFAPTATDRDFKNGEDALLVTRLADSGAELEAIVVQRRAPGRKRLKASQGSYGLRYRGAAGAIGYEFVAAQHFDDQVAMASLSGPAAGAVWRVDWVGSWDNEELTHSLVANIDYAFGFGDQSGYAFLEYYHNGFGSNDAADNIINLQPDALERLARGELFVLERNYAALGTSLGLSPLLNLNTTALINLQDGAPLVQSALNYTAGNNLTLEFGGILPLGGAGDEFGGVVLQDPQLLLPESTLDPLLSATSRQLYLRAVWFL